MIDKFEDLELEQLDNLDLVQTEVEKKLGLTITSMKEALQAWVTTNADELAKEFTNIAPLGDYTKMMEEPGKMSEFLKTEASKLEHWQLTAIYKTDEKSSLLTFNFSNDAVDDGDLLQGFVYVSFQGKIKHAFAQGE